VHASETGAPPFDVKVAFIELHPNSVFSGGEPENSHIRVEGLIKGGRGPEVKKKILEGLDKVLQPWSKEGSAQTTLVEALPTASHASFFCGPTNI
jgi:Putative oxalocrotonate tautomerase enzyme